MLLSIDIGNSSVSFGVFKLSDALPAGVDLVYSFRIATRSITADEYALLIRDFLRVKRIFPSPSALYSDSTDSENDMGSCVNCAAVASVVPIMTDTLCTAAEMITGTRPFVIESGIRTGLGIRIKNPAQLGADIVANAAYAAAVDDAPLIILDVGTATTLTVVDADKNILGTIIMPGLAISLSALSGSAAQLNGISLSAPFALIGRDSDESVRSGVVNGHAIMVDGFLRNIREQYPSLTAGSKLSLVSTGGLSSVILPHMRNKFSDFPQLTLFGVAYLYYKNRQ